MKSFSSSFCEVINYNWSPNRVPDSGQMVRIQRTGSFKNITVGEHWNVSELIAVFDCISFARGNEFFVFQIMPTENPDVGVLQLIKMEPPRKGYGSYVGHRPTENLATGRIRIR